MLLEIMPLNISSATKGSHFVACQRACSRNYRANCFGTTKLQKAQYYCTYKVLHLKYVTFLQNKMATLKIQNLNQVQVA